MEAQQPKAIKVDFGGPGFPKIKDALPTEEARQLLLVSDFIISLHLKLGFSIFSFLVMPPPRTVVFLSFSGPNWNRKNSRGGCSNFIGAVVPHGIGVYWTAQW